MIRRLEQVESQIKYCAYTPWHYVSSSGHDQNTSTTINSKALHEMLNHPRPPPNASQRWYHDRPIHTPLPHVQYEGFRI